MTAFLLRTELKKVGSVEAKDEIEVFGRLLCADDVKCRFEEGQ